MMLNRTRYFRTHRFRKSLLVLLILLFSVAVVAQSRTRSKKIKFNASNPALRNWSVQGTIGFGSYYGDLSIYDSEPFSKFAEESKFSMGVVVSNKFLPFMGVQARLLWGRYQASSTVFNRKLDGNAYVGGVNLMVDIINLFSIPEEVFPEIYIYGVAGLGLMKMRPTISNLYSGEVIQGTHYQDKAEITPYYGIGFNKSLNKQWDLTIESILYNVNSDKLDGLYDDLSKDYLLYTSVGFKYNIKSLSKSSRNKYARSRAPIRR
jgi:hypothetical protein